MKKIIICSLITILAFSHDQSIQETFKTGYLKSLPGLRRVYDPSGIQQKEEILKQNENSQNLQPNKEFSINRIQSQPWSNRPQIHQNRQRNRDQAFKHNKKYVENHQNQKYVYLFTENFPSLKADYLNRN